MKPTIPMLFVFFLINAFCNAQSVDINDYSHNSTGTDQRLLIHYTESELNEILNSDIEKYRAIEYYHTRSYIIQNLYVDESLPFYLNTFDITKYERFRKSDETVVKNLPKHGVKLILISVQDLEYKLPIHLPIPTENEED